MEYLSSSNCSNWAVVEFTPNVKLPLFTVKVPDEGVKVVLESAVNEITEELKFTEDTFESSIWAYRYPSSSFLIFGAPKE